MLCDEVEEVVITVENAGVKVTNREEWMRKEKAGGLHQNLCGVDIKTSKGM